MATRINLKNVVLSFPKIFEAEPFEAGGKPRYSAAFLVPKGSDLEEEIEQAIKSEAQAKWGKTWEKTLASVRGSSNKCSWQDGDLSKYESDEGHWVLRATRAEKDGPPTVQNRDKTPLTAASGKIYGGVIVNGIVEIWAQTGQYTGIRTTLLGVQFVKDGESFGGAARLDANEAFDDLGVSEEENDLT